MWCSNNELRIYIFCFLDNIDERFILTIFGIFYTNDFSTRVKSTHGKKGFAKVRLCYPLAAMCSHSCISNTSRQILGLEENFLAVITASQTIKKGDKILFNYLDIMLPTIIRQNMLREVVYHYNINWIVATTTIILIRLVTSLNSD